MSAPESAQAREPDIEKDRFHFVLAVALTGPGWPRYANLDTSVSSVFTLKPLDIEPEGRWPHDSAIWCRNDAIVATLDELVEHVREGAQNAARSMLNIDEESRKRAPAYVEMTWNNNARWQDRLKALGINHLTSAKDLPPEVQAVRSERHERLERMEQHGCTGLPAWRQSPELREFLDNLCMAAAIGLERLGYQEPIGYPLEPAELITILDMYVQDTRMRDSAREDYRAKDVTTTTAAPEPAL